MKESTTRTCPGLCWAVPGLSVIFPGLQELDQVTTAEKPPGSSPSVLAITPLARPCLYLKVQQEVLMWTSFLLDSRNDEQSWVLIRKSYNSSNDQNGVTLTQAGSACGSEAHSVLHSSGIWRDVGLSILPFFCSATASKWHFKQSEHLCYCYYSKVAPSA